MCLKSVWVCVCVGVCAVFEVCVWCLCVVYVQCVRCMCECGVCV